jgi:hypothetical protein
MEGEVKRLLIYGDVAGKVSLAALLLGLGLFVWLRSARGRCKWFVFFVFSSVLYSAGL